MQCRQEIGKMLEAVSFDRAVEGATIPDYNLGTDI